jgi:phosphohistidine phosphatase
MPETERRLILLRHAKAAHPNGMADEDRPLTERGQADAAAAGRALAEIGVPDLVLCSPAARTRQTWRAAARAAAADDGARDLIAAVRLEFEPVLYGASVREVISLVRTVPARVGTVLVVGHEPTMSTTAIAVAGPGSADAALERLGQGYPTSGLAVFSTDSRWVDFGAGDGVLEQFLIPRD